MLSKSSGIWSGIELMHVRRYVAQCSICFTSCQLKRGIISAISKTHISGSKIILWKPSAVSQALGHETQVNIRTNKFYMNYWWILEAGFLLSPSEPPVIELWLWQHAQGVKKNIHLQDLLFFTVILGEGKTGSACAYICITCLLFPFSAWEIARGSMMIFKAFLSIVTIHIKVFACSLLIYFFHHQKRCHCLQRACMILHSFNSLWE